MGVGWQTRKCKSPGKASGWSLQGKPIQEMPVETQRDQLRNPAGSHSFSPGHCFSLWIPFFLHLFLLATLSDAALDTYFSWAIFSLTPLSLDIPVSWHLFFLRHHEASIFLTFFSLAALNLNVSSSWHPFLLTSPFLETFFWHVWVLTSFFLRNPFSISPSPAVWGLLPA